MKQGLHATQGLAQKQTQNLTAQLQHAVKILQLSHFALLDEIELALESNPFLDRAENSFTTHPNDQGDSAYHTPQGMDGAIGSDDSLNFRGASHFNEPPDFESAAYSSSPPSSLIKVRQSNADHSGNALENIGSYSTGLHELLRDQAHATPLSDDEHVIISMLIESVDERGYLTCSADDIVDWLLPERVISRLAVEKIIHVLQSFEPEGVGTRSLQECLLVQLALLSDSNDPKTLNTAIRIVSHHLDDVAENRTKAILRNLSIRNKDYARSLALIRSLNPTPGLAYSSVPDQYIRPDIEVFSHHGKWRARLIDQSLPNLMLNQHYIELLKSNAKNSQHTALKGQLEKARALLGHLEKRQQTILLVAETILTRQQSYFELGDIGIQPLTLQDVADAIDMHPSTISRAANEKYMLFAGKTIPFKHFFSGGIGSGNDSETSARAIQAMIRAIIADEDPQKPVSDNQLMALLKQKDISIARRTIAKYRDLLHIPSSAKRRAHHNP